MFIELNLPKPKSFRLIESEELKRRKQAPPGIHMYPEAATPDIFEVYFENINDSMVRLSVLLHMVVNQRENPYPPVVTKIENPETRKMMHASLHDFVLDYDGPRVIGAKALFELHRVAES